MHNYMYNRYANANELTPLLHHVFSRLAAAIFMLHAAAYMSLSNIHFSNMPLVGSKFFLDDEDPLPLQRPHGIKSTVLATVVAAQHYPSGKERRQFVVASQRAR